MGEGRHRPARGLAVRREQGLLGIDVDEQYGGGGVRDFRYNAVLVEEMVRIGASGLGFGLHNDVVGPYLLDLATDEQKQRWLPGFCSGELITAIAMTEPGAGSDLQGIQTTARKDGDGWVLNGSKTFITNGINSDLVIVVAKTDPDAAGARASACSWSSGTCRASPAAATWRRSGSRRRTPPSCSSTTCGCRPRTCSARRTAASST